MSRDFYNKRLTTNVRPVFLRLNHGSRVLQSEKNRFGLRTIRDTPGTI